MPMLKTGVTNMPSRTGVIYRSYVASRLAALGVSEASARTSRAQRPQKLSEAITEASEAPRGDILGVPGWSVVTSQRLPLDVAGAVDAARVAAALDGNERWAAVCARPGAGPEASYVVTSLEVLADIIKAQDHATAP